MKAVILANLISKTLHPIEDPYLLSFNGQALILHWIRDLSRNGLTNIIIVANSKNFLKIQLLTAELPHDIQIIEDKSKKISHEKGLLLASSFLEGYPFIVLRANQFFDTKFLENFVQRIATDNPESLVALKQIEDNSGQFTLDRNNNLKLVKKDEGEYLSLGVHYFQDGTKLFQDLANTTHLEVLNKLIKNGTTIKTLHYLGFHQDLDFPWDIIALANYFHSKVKGQGISSSAKIHGSAVISGEVVIEDNVKIDANAVIKGPAYIGKNTIIGVNSFIRQSFIGPDSVIGFSSEVTRSFLDSKVWTHNNYIGDSVIGSNVSFGGGTMVGNLRLDEGEIKNGKNKLGLSTGNNIRIGINNSFMPGITIGSNSMIGAGLVIAEHIPIDSFVSSKTKLEIKNNLKSVNHR